VGSIGCGPAGRAEGGEVPHPWLSGIRTSAMMMMMVAMMVLLLLELRLSTRRHARAS
jgi:hypothetical protein